MAAYIAGWVLRVPAVAAAASALAGSNLLEAGAAIKMLPVVLLGVSALGSASGKWIGFGLLLSSVGDACLDMQARDPRLFLAGLASFLCGHLCYIAAFLRAPRRDNAVLALVAAVFPAGMLYVLVPHLKPDLVVPVAVYASVISAMAYAALTRTASGTTAKGVRRAAAGALVFVVSDSVLALDKFVSPLPHAKLVVMLTYYAAQLLMSASVHADGEGEGEGKGEGKAAATTRRAAPAGSKGKGKQA
jgi:uncharacterized membrane protein YhhN